MCFLVLCIFMRLFWRAHERLVKQPPGCKTCQLLAWQLSIQLWQGCEPFVNSLTLSEETLNKKIIRFFWGKMNSSIYSINLSYSLKRWIDHGFLRAKLIHLTLKPEKKVDILPDDNFTIHFIERNYVYVDENFDKVYLFSEGFSWQYVRHSSNHGVVPNSWWGITWTNDDQVHWYIYLYAVMKLLRGSHFVCFNSFRQSDAYMRQ